MTSSLDMGVNMCVITSNRAPFFLAQLTQMEQVITAYLALYPANSGSFVPPFAQFSPTLRRGIVYMRRGHGWKLTRNWRSALETKRQTLEGELLQGVPQ